MAAVAWRGLRRRMRPMFSVLGPGARTTVPSRLIGFRFPFSGFPFSAPVPGPPFSDGSSAFGFRSRGFRSRPRYPDHRSRTAHRLSVSVLGPGTRTTVLGRLIGFRVPFSAPVPGPPFPAGSSAFGSRSRPRYPDHRSQPAHRLSGPVLGLGTRTTVLSRLIGFRVPFSASVPDHRPDPAHQLPPPRAGVARGSLKH